MDIARSSIICPTIARAPLAGTGPTRASIAEQLREKRETARQIKREREREKEMGSGRGNRKNKEHVKQRVNSDTQEVLDCG